MVETSSGTRHRARRSRRAPRERTSAVIVEKPFIDPKKETPKQELAGTAGGQD